MAVPLLPLAADEVHVWHAAPERFQRPETLERFAALLSADETARQVRFVHLVDRQLYLVAHALVRLTLSRYLDVAPEAWQFAANEFGRPQIVAPDCGRRLQFNLSHARGQVVCGVTWDRPLGVDVEVVQRGASALKLASRYFSPSELAELQSLSAAAQPERFIEYWTLKEAYLKARGVGLSLGLDQFSMRIAAGQPISIAFAPGFDGGASRWQFAQFRPTSEHLAALAVGLPQAGDCRISWREFTAPGEPPAR